MNPQRSRGRAVTALLAAVVAVLFTVFISFQMFGGGSVDAVIQAMTATADYQNVLLVNILVGVSIALFIYELRWNALRVTVTVIFALLLGFLVTGAFNLDKANQFTQGEFRVRIVTDAEPIENEEVDLEYGRQLGDEFNKPGAREPLSEAVYTFEGRADDMITVLAYPANRRSSVDMQVSLLDPSGTEIGAANSASDEQFERYGDDLRSLSDPVLENIILPEDGIYTIVTRPEPLQTGTILSEAVRSTVEAYQAFLLGPLGRINRWAVWIQDALTLILVGLAIAIVFRAKQFSLGAEGQLYFGALASGVIALSFGHLPPLLIIPLALLSAMTVGFLWGLLPGVLKAYLGANELVSTLMLNTIAIRFYELVLTFQLKPPTAGYISSDQFAAGGVLPSIVEGTQVSIAVFLVIIAVFAAWLLVERTPIGYEIRMIGSNIRFANYGGVNTRRAVMLSMALSGIVAGLAGAHLSMGIHRMLIINISLGLAFEGVVVALLARNNPLVIPFTGLLYAYLRAGAQFMERDANVSFEVVLIIQAVIILLISAEALAAFFQNRRTTRRGADPSDGSSLTPASGQPVVPAEG